MIPSSPPHIEPTDAAGRALILRRIAGPVVMLNLLRFRAIADYSASPELAPAAPISGAAAFQKYIDHTLPHLAETGGELTFLGGGGGWLIGPAEERWDLAMLVRQASIEAFMAFAAHEPYLAGIGHRTAAVEDSRLLPLVERTGAADPPRPRQGWAEASRAIAEAGGQPPEWPELGETPTR